MDLLLQLQADQCGVPVTRPHTTEVTALGAAMLAGLAEGVWGSLEELAALLTRAEVFEPPRSGPGRTPITPPGKSALGRSTALGTRASRGGVSRTP